MSARLFVAVDLPPTARAVIAAWRDGALARVDGLRPVPDAALHVTLCFLGSQPEGQIAAVGELVAARTGPAPQLALGAPAWLPRWRPRVLALALHDPDGTLAALQAAVGGALAGAGRWRAPARPFLAHVTVARARGEKTQPRDLPAPEPLAFAGAALTLYRSRLSPAGARYEPLRRVELSAQFHWHPEAYVEEIRADLPGYDRLQDEVAMASAAEVDRPVRSILELGSGTGETARRVLARHPGARLHGIDASAEMLARAREALDGGDVRLELGRLEDPLPPGPFELVVSALAVHHLDDTAKADLFARVHAALAPGARLVLGDVVVPRDPREATASLTPGYDRPSPVVDQLAWLRAAGLSARVAWEHGDLAVLVGERPGRRRGG